MATERDTRLDTINSALTTNPFCSGVWLVEAADLALFYLGTDGAASHIDFGHAKPKELDQLTAACRPATFGLNKEDVLDETYRKAGKLDSSQFMTRFNPAESGLLDAVRAHLLEGEAQDEEIKAQLYKLNVYGQGSFFKAHKDTPRDERMFGSLVIILPAPHTGGALVIRHHSQEWTLELDAQLKGQSSPKVGYIAFFSDVEHEVLPVTSGHRITLTYNLFYAEPPRRPSTTPTSGNETTLLEALSVIHDPSFFPGGTSLGFGLLHQYPISTSPAEDRLNELKSQLKGTDAMLFRTLKSLKLDPQLYVLYRRKGKWAATSDFFLCSHFVDFARFADGMYADSDIDESLIRGGGGALISCPDPVLAEAERQNQIARYRAARMVPAEEDLDASDHPNRHITWVSLPTGYNETRESYVAYGNEAELSYMYADICIVVTVDDVEGRIQSGMVIPEWGRAWLEEEPVEDKARRETLKKKVVEKKQRLEEEERRIAERREAARLRKMGVA